MKKSIQFSPEVRERAVRMVIEHRAGYPSEWATLVSIASKIVCTPETLRTWCRRQGGNAVPANKDAAESERIKALERGVRELKKANEMLRLASSYSAQAELDRRLK